MICTKVELRLNWTHSSPKHQERFQCMWITPKCNVIQSRGFGLITDLCNSKVKHELTHLHQYLKRCHHHHLQLNKKRETWMQLWSVERALWVDEMLLHPLPPSPPPPPPKKKKNGKSFRFPTRTTDADAGCWMELRSKLSPDFSFRMSRSRRHLEYN